MAMYMAVCERKKLKKLMKGYRLPLPDTRQSTTMGSPVWMFQEANSYLTNKDFNLELLIMERVSYVVWIIICLPYLKGSVSRVLRWVLLYINRKFFSRPIIASHKILTFIKGSVHNLQKTGRRTLVQWYMVLFRQYWNQRKMWVAQY